MELRTITFTAPSGHSFTIREQNGEDESILTNPREMRTLLHLSRFISAIVVKTDITASGKLSMDDALDLPLLDRYCILFQSRIFSLGEDIEFTYEWVNEINGRKNEVSYEENLNNYLFSNYGETPSEEELDSKPYAIPFYPEPEITNGKVFTLSSGKEIWWQAATSRSEQFIFNLAEDKRTSNAEMMARNLKLKVDNNFEKVSNFSLFSVRDMAEIRTLIKTFDPPFLGVTDIQNPETGEVTQYPIIGAPDFFILSEA